MTQIVADDKKFAESNAAEIMDRLHGGRCVLPRGTTFVSQRIWVPGGSELYGDGGMAGSILKQIGQPGAEAGGLLLWGEGFNFTGGYALDVAEGALTIPAPSTGNSLVYVTDGPAKDVWAGAQELRGEWRRGVGDGQSIRLDRPLRRGYHGVIALSGRPVTDVYIHDLSVAQPEHGGAYKFLGKFAADVRLECVRFGLPGDPPAGWGFASSGHVELLDVDSYDAQLGLNTSHDVRIVGGRYGGIVGEECCTDTLIADVRIVPAGRPMQGLYWYLGSDRLVGNRVRVEGGGAANPAGGSFAPFAAWGRECRFEDFATVASVNLGPGLSGCGGGGDSWTMEGVKFDLPFWLTEGKGCRIGNSAAPSWTLFNGTDGRLRDCDGELPWGSTGWDASGQEGAEVAVQGVATTRAALEEAVGRFRERVAAVDWAAVGNPPPRAV